jgi:hypothetical protein
VIVGAVVSTVIAKTAETSLTLPAVSVACAAILCTEPANKFISKVKLPLLQHLVKLLPKERGILSLKKVVAL